MPTASRFRRNFLRAGTMLLLAPTAMFGQACQGLAGTWYDNDGFIWRITQSGNSVSGTIEIPGCPGWQFTGSVSQQGGFTLTATGSACPASSFTVTGENYPPGCNYGDGNWTNNLNEQGYFSWSNNGACPLPDYENTGDIGWEVIQGAVYDWNATVGSFSGELFGGRTVQEVDGGYGSDSCWISQSPYSKYDQIQNPSSWTVDWNESYVDLVGWYNDAFFWYQENRPVLGYPLPCAFQWNQTMQMACASGSFATYNTNFLSGEINTDTATSYRSYYSHSHLWHR